MKHVIVKAKPFCNIHLTVNKEDVPAYADARLPGRGWAYVCRTCFIKFKCSLGEGRGQRLLLAEEALEYFVAVDKEGEVVAPGQEIKNFRDEVAVFERVSALPAFDKMGKIAVNQFGASREYYPSVFGLKIEFREISPLVP